MDDKRIYRHHKVFEAWLKATQDGFIVVDRQGIITDINEQYCDFLGRKYEDVIGHRIDQIISTTKMYEVMETRHMGDGPDGVYIHPYMKGDVRENVDTVAVGNRFCFFDENDEVIGSAAQVVFKERSADMQRELHEGELKFYKEEYMRNQLGSNGFDNIIARSARMDELKKRALKIAKRNFPILITGETGTGKEMFAKALHLESDRGDKTMISINCAAIPSELLESELFGYEPGSFTGALKNGKIGKFQLADGGTLFLDEIGDMPLPLQAKLLRVLQERQIEKIGGKKPIPIDVRVISATRQNLEKMIEEGTFREDLYYRLNVINLNIPPLRDRREDILLLAEYALSDLNKQYLTSTIFSDAVKRAFREYNWPGNVRELINVVTSAYATSDYEIITEMELPAKIANKAILQASADGEKKLCEMVAEYEAELIKAALKRNNYVCRATAEELGIDRSLLYKKMRKAGIAVKKSFEE